MNDSLQSAHAVDDHKAIAMVELVLPYTAKEFVGLLLEFFSINILGPDAHLGGSSDLGGDSGYGEAALFAANCSAELKQLGININSGLIHLVRRTGHEELEVQSQLGGCQADAVGLLHYLEHAVGEGLEAFVKELDSPASDL